MKCLNCDNNAKWKSTKYQSPLCSKCAREEVDKLLSTGNFDTNYDGVKYFYELIEQPVFLNGSTQDHAGRIVRLAKNDAINR